MLAELQDVSRAKRLKARTNATHDRLDQSVMAARPFESRDRYIGFLRMQHAFHRDIAPLYRDAGLQALLPGLADLGRLEVVSQDLADLGAEPAPAGEPAFPGAIDAPTALGWLYVAEGSNLGAAFLLKAAGELGLSETFGARHLAAAPEGRGLSWRRFTAALDAPTLTAEEEERVIAGAEAAFARVHGLVRSLLG